MRAYDNPDCSKTLDSITKEDFTVESDGEVVYYKVNTLKAANYGIQTPFLSLIPAFQIKGLVDDTNDSGAVLKVEVRNSAGDLLVSKKYSEDGFVCMDEIKTNVADAVVFEFSSSGSSTVIIGQNRTLVQPRVESKGC